MSAHTTRGLRDSPTQSISVNGATFVYREGGVVGGIPLIALTHLGANLDSWDPSLADGLAENGHVIAVGYRGVGGSSGTLRPSIEEMADDVIAVIRALGHPRVDLFGLSMGGMVAQSVATHSPQLVRRMILAGSGAAGGPGLAKMTGVFVRSALRSAATLADPKAVMFFTRTPTGRSAAKAYLARLKLRKSGLDAKVTPAVYLAHLAAVRRWGLAAPVDLAHVTAPTLLIHGDSDRLVPPENASVLADRLPHSTVVIYPDSGHGVAFQNHAAVIKASREFLSR